MRDGSDMLSAMARGEDGVALVEFAEANNVRDDWTNSALSASVSGRILSNINGTDLHDPLNQHAINPELLVHLQGFEKHAVFNLATVLAMATAYCRRQQELAKRAVAARNKATKDARSNKVKNKSRGRPKTANAPRSRP